MDRTRRTRILIEGDPQLRRELSARVEGRRSISVVEEPRGGLVMLKLRETAKNSLFYMGELLVTEAKVQIEGRMGLGIIAGDDPEAARDLAVIDAACNAGVPETGEWEGLLLAEEERIAVREAQESARIARTTVDFESMDRSPTP